MESKEPVVKGIAYLFWNADVMLYFGFFQEGAGEHGKKNSDRGSGADQSPVENS